MGGETVLAWGVAFAHIALVMALGAARAALPEAGGPGGRPGDPRRNETDMTAMHETEVLAANEAFYRAFDDGDREAMRRLWASRAPVVCVHPGRRGDHRARSGTGKLGRDPGRADPARHRLPLAERAVL